MSSEIPANDGQRIVQCPRCGGLGTFSPEGICQACGLDLYAELRQARTNPVREFQERLATLTPRLVATPAIVFANIAVFVAMAVAGVNILNPKAQSVLDWGANFAPKTMNGEWWRLVTSMFLHFGIIHIGFNMWVLWDLGRIVERLVGNVGFLLLYFASGIAGSLASLAWNANIISAGASGAVFGVAGALLGFILLRRDTVPAAMRKHLRNSMLVFLVLNLGIGMSIPRIDMAAHVGGFVAGLVCGLVLSQPLTDGARTRRRIRNAALAVIATFSLIGAAKALPPAPPDVNAELKHLSEVEENANSTYNALWRQWRDEKIKDAEFADKVERDVLGPWKEGRRRMEQVVDAARDDRPNLQKLSTYMKAREESWQLLVEGLREQNVDKLTKSQQRGKEADAIVKSMGKKEEE